MDETTNFGIRTKFELTEKMRDEADELLHERGDGNTATSDRGRDEDAQRRHSYIGCLGEVAFKHAFDKTPLAVEFLDGISGDAVLGAESSDEGLDVEVKTRHHKPDINHEQRDMFLRKKSPSEMSVDIIALMKVYPNYRGVWDRAEFIGFCTPEHAGKWKQERQDIAHHTKKWEIRERYLRDNFDILAPVVKKTLEKSL